MMTFLFASQIAQGSVNLVTGAWIWNFNFNGLKIDYSSRSLHQGRWGQGWCSPIDVSIKRTEKMDILFEKCSERVTDFQIQQIESGVQIETSESNYIFDKVLRLVRLTQKNLNIELQWKGSDLEALKINEQIFAVRLNQRKQIVQLDGEVSRLTLAYRYQLLVGLNDGSMRESFKYDTLDNMIQVSTLSKQARINYNENDQVKWVSTGANCSSIYNYTNIVRKKLVQRISKVQRSCGEDSQLAKEKIFLSRYVHVQPGKIQLTDIKEL